MTWNAVEFDFSSDKVKVINVLKYFEKELNELKRMSFDYNDFSNKLKREMMWRYWSKAEHESIITLQISADGIEHVFLQPWIGRNTDEYKIEVTNDKNFDWVTFAKLHISKQVYKNEAKIDVYDQLMFRWKEFVDYCWDIEESYE